MIYQQLLQTARELLREGRTTQASHCLQAACKLKPAELDAHNLLEEHCLPGALGPAFGVNGLIHPSDEIYRFFATHHTSLNPPRDYLSDGWRTRCELQMLCEQLERPLSRCANLLEFACGYGRFTRHLVNVLPASCVCVSDVMPGSVDFLQQQLGVQGFYSCMEPETLHIAHKFEVIFVLSLFSHLPDKSWQTWLGKLYSALRPGGMLIISTHGPFAAKQVGVQIPASGHFFVPESESATLDARAYGCTYTSDHYVRAAIASLPRQPAAVHHHPAYFWSRQDAWSIIAPQN